MQRQSHAHWLFVLTALGFLFLGLSFVIVRARTPYDGARLEPGGQAWLPNGILASPLKETTNGLQVGDTIIAIEGKPTSELAQILMRLDSSRDMPALGQTITYSILRNDQPMEVQAKQVKYPFGALLSHFWGIYVVVLTLQLMMTYVLVRRPEEPAAQALFVFAWSLWHFPAWTMGMQTSDILSGWGYWHYRLVTSPTFLLTFSALLHTSLVFPKRHPILDRFPRLVPIIYLAPYGLFVIFMTVTKFLSANKWIWLGYWNAGEESITALYLILFIAATIVNYRRVRDETTRIKIRWMALGWGISAIGVILLWMLPVALFGQALIPASALALFVLPVPAAIAIAILRHHLFDIDIVINRALAYGTLTTVIVVVYVVIVGYAGALFHTEASDHSQKDILLSLIAAGLVAAIFQPMRESLQRLVNRFMYGERDDPYTVLTRLGEKLEAVGTVETTLPTIVETIAQALKLPYVAIEFKDGDGSRVAAAYGTPQSYPVTKFPLIYQNGSFGDLVLAQRSGSESFTLNETRLLTDLTREVEVAAYNVRLTADLQRSRQELVTSREEERRRIRRDLHDGIGPILASQTLTLEAMEKLVTRDPAQVIALIKKLKSQSEQAVLEIRSVISNLRPSILDDMGLSEALREGVAHLGNHSTIVHLNIENNLPKLSAATELAVYRISMEALTNVMRHARAHNCHLHLWTDCRLNLEITDDGIGLLDGFREGVGLASIRERAEELGGDCSIGNLSPRGARVLVYLPLYQELT